MGAPTLVWFRQDLRLADQPAIRWAAERGAVIPVYVWSPDEEGDWPPGGTTRWWLHHSLKSLGNALHERGSRLILRTGPAADTLRKLAKETGAERVAFCRRYEPAAKEVESAVTDALEEAGVEVKSFNGSLLNEPDTIETQSGGPYRVFTPYWKTCRGKTPAAPEDAPDRLEAPGSWPGSEPLDALQLLPTIDWAGGLRDAWTPGEAGARDMLADIGDGAVDDYADGRNRPATRSTTRLSPHLHFGEVSPQAAWHALQARAEGESAAGKDMEEIQRQLYWREFAYHLLGHYPQTPTEALQQKFNAMPWSDDADARRRWERGRTGFPIVDAGMRELWETGWMHNRVRMIVASFLTKDLMIGWEAGTRWFWDTLVDADLANNTLGWQWTAGCGADAAPFFRVFNPVGQGERFDPEGTYVKRYVPELAKLPKAQVHKPWEATPMELTEAGVELGKDYPHPMVDHAKARERALAAYEKVKAAK